MAHRGHHPLEIGDLSETKLIRGRLTGAGAADMVRNSGDVLTAARQSAGVFNLTFKHKYPQGVLPLKPGIVGTTTGLDAILTAWDPLAGTATIKFSVGSVATDPATTDVVYLGFFVRNSNANPRTADL